MFIPSVKNIGQLATSQHGQKDMQPKDQPTTPQINECQCHGSIQNRKKKNTSGKYVYCKLEHTFPRWFNFVTPFA
jgi:hypothetical protein